MAIVSDIFTTLGSIITQIVTLIGSLFEGVTDLFYISGEGGGLTFVGVLSLVALGFSLFWLGFNFIRGLIKTRG